jgi:anti-sigma-K factor RskA
VARWLNGNMCCGLFWGAGDFAAGHRRGAGFGRDAHGWHRARLCWSELMPWRWRILAALFAGVMLAVAAALSSA